jgi:AmmeMemoRadiSam system protein A
MLTLEARRRLIELARAALVARVQGTAFDDAWFQTLSGCQAGAFVTLWHRGDLRGCIGHPDADQPVEHVIARSAGAAAREDPRFTPVSPEEVEEIVIEISVLGPLEMIGGPDDIEIGRHGLVVEDGGVRGLLLPQVAVEWNWDRETFLAQTCRKAGLPDAAWRGRASVLRFEAEVFRSPDREIS